MNKPAPPGKQLWKGGDFDGGDNMKLEPGLGRRVFITMRAEFRLCEEDVKESLRRHARGDWGDLTPEDDVENAIAMADGRPSYSTYHDRNGTKFYIVTALDRSVTTVLVPSD